MYQSIQSTGVYWTLTLIIPNVRKSYRLSYTRDFKELIKYIQTGLPIKVYPDAIMMTYFRITPTGMEIKKETFERDYVKKYLTTHSSHARIYVRGR